MAYGWGILPRDLFIVLWILMALLLGLYLLGVFSFRKNAKRSKPGIAAVITAIASLAFAAWLIPGLWGAPLKAVSAFTPPMSTQIFGADTSVPEPQFTDYAQALEESGGDIEYASLPELHRFVIPDGCHWQDLRERTENLGSAIVESMRMIERANPNTLYGVLSTFSKAQWTDKSVLTDSRLKDLIEHMSKVRLGNANYPADLMGDAYEILLKKFADLSKAKAGEFYTPRAIVRLLVRILNPQAGESVYDPACGSGGMLIEAAHYMHYSTLCCGRLFGQEKNVTNAAISKMNLFLHGAAPRFFPKYTCTALLLYRI